MLGGIGESGVGTCGIDVGSRGAAAGELRLRVPWLVPSTLLSGPGPELSLSDRGGELTRDPARFLAALFGGVTNPDDPGLEGDATLTNPSLVPVAVFGGEVADIGRLCIPGVTPTIGDSAGDSPGFKLSPLKLPGTGTDSAYSNRRAVDDKSGSQRSSSG